MDFRVNQEQQALKSAVRSFCDARFSVERLKELERSPRLDRALWRGLAELGIFALSSSGCGASEAVLAFAELGRRLVPGPLVWTYLAAGFVEGAEDGSTIVGGLDETGAGGERILIENLESLDTVLVIRRSGIERIDPRTLDATPIETPLDPLTPVHRIARLPKGELIGGSEQAERTRLLGTALVAAQLLGIAEMARELAVAYAKVREQFGRPIGSFQAIKHICADMFVRQELARSAVYAAGATIDHPEVGSVERAVSSAKVVASLAADKNARACLQVHGGMGYTWEVPVHYYLKRSWILRTVFGASSDHAERIARELVDQAGVISAHA
jgi:alkylation response protein AidB-like acyl-CoA dehydrogenase